MTRGASWNQREDDELAVHAELEASGVVHPVDVGGRDEVLWMDCELASFAENRLGDCADPRGLDAARREVWRARATTEPIAPPSQRAYDRCYWLLRRGERVGTVALSTSSLGGSALRLSSLYVFPTHRGSGIATKACAAMSHASGRHEYALRLSTNWSWQKAVRMYLRIGMWLRMWKRDLEFHWHTREPAPVVEMTDVRACLSVVVHGRKVLLAQAVREADRLVSFERESFDDSDLEALAWNAGTTLSLAMALAGWPLVRSSESWERHRYSDAVSPESLAYKISIWEAWDRDHGWQVDTPRIVGLDYPTWQELEVRWQHSE